MIEEIDAAKRSEGAGSKDGILRTAEYKECFANVRFYSPTATADDEYLLEKAPKVEPNVGSFLTSCLGPGIGSNFLRTTVSDRVLAGTMVGELSLRGVDIKSKSHVILLSEWDSAYGRALPLSVRKEIEQATRRPGKLEWIHVYSYPRGLDGQKSKGRTSPKNEEKGDNETDQSKKAEKQLQLRTSLPKETASWTT